ncbi:MAG: ABC transporter substrate-binding protein [Anaerolineales bacterium]
MSKPCSLCVALILASLLAACASPPGLTQASPAATSSTAAATSGETDPPPSATPSVAPENLPDLSGQTIVLFHLCDQSGLLGTANAGHIQAVEDMVAAINSGGGIYGAQLDLRFADTEGNADAAQRALARLIRQWGEPPLALICDPITEGALAQQLNEDEIPALGPGTFAEADGYIFGLDASAEAHLAFFLENLGANWTQRKPEGAGDAIRVALINWPPDLAGRLTGEDSPTDADELGLQIVMEEDFPAEPDANVFDLIYQARDENANVIYTNARGFGLAALLNALYDLGLRERFVVAAPALALDAQVYEYLANPSYAAGLYVTSAWAWWGEDNPGIQELIDIRGDSAAGDWGYIEMAGAVSVARRALEVAILAEGYESLSPEAVTAALRELDEYLAFGGLFVVDYTTGPTSAGSLRVWQVGEGTWELTEIE